MEASAVGRDRVLITQLVNCLGIGGTERQLVEHLRRLDTERFLIDLCCHHKIGELLADVRALSLEPTEIGLRGTLFQPNTIVQIVRLARRMRDQRAALLHAHDFYSNLIGSAAARLAGIPYIVSRRDMGAWIDWKRATALAAVTRRAPFVLCNAYAIRDQLVNDEGVDPARITVVCNGLDVARFDREAARAPDPALPVFNGDGPIVVLVANMKHPLKGHEELLRAASASLKVLPSLRFLLVGDGDYRPAFERQAAALGIAHAVVFTGRRTDVPALLARCHIAVSTSHSEGLSNAVMEGMAARLPVVATSVGGNVELVRDGRTGFLFRKGDVVALAQRLVELGREPLLARRMGAAGRRYVEQELTADTMHRKMEALYTRILRLQWGQRRAA